MMRALPLSRSLALLALTNLSLAPALAPVVAHADMQTATTASLSAEEDVNVQTTATTATTTTNVTADNLAEIIAGLGSSDMEILQVRYTELQELIANYKASLTSMADGDEKTEITEYISKLEDLEDAFETIIQAHANDTGTTTTYVNEDGDTVTRVTYANGSYTETITPAADADDDDSAGDYDNASESGSGSGGGSDILSKLMENPIVQALVTSLLQKLLNGGLGSLDGMLSGLFSNNGAATNGDTLLGRTCTRGKCSGSDYSTPNPTGTASNATTGQNVTGGTSGGIGAVDSSLPAGPK